MEILPKEKNNAFGKDIYLLGEDAEGQKYWLEAPSWDCGWYWGFGYIETYTNNSDPSRAKDINSHQHADNFMAEYFTEWNGSKPVLKNRTFDEKEGWELSELFREFYFLRDSAQYWKDGNCHVSGDGLIPKDQELADKINKVIIPSLTARILEILTNK